MSPATVIEPEKILKELRELWVQLGQQENAPGGVLRACAMTLVVAAEPDGNGVDAEAAHRGPGVDTAPGVARSGGPHARSRRRRRNGGSLDARRRKAGN